MAYRTGKIRGYGACNDNAVGLMGMYGAARELGVPGPLCMENDYSIVNRRIEENGLSEASSPAIANSGFLAYNVLAGGPRRRPTHAIAATPSPRPLAQACSRASTGLRPATASLPRPSTTATGRVPRSTPRLLEVGWTRGAGA